jgi:hypothetical protein
MHERIKIYREFYHCIIYIANEGRHVRIKDNFLLISLVHDVSIFQSRNTRAKSLPLVLGAPLDGEQSTTLLLISLWYMMFLYFRVVIRELRVYL